MSGWAGFGLSLCVHRHGRDMEGCFEGSSRLCTFIRLHFMNVMSNGSLRDTNIQILYVVKLVCSEIQ